MPRRTGVGVSKAGIQKEVYHSFIVFQDLVDDVYLLELETKVDASLLVNNGLNVEEFHIGCSPPHGKFLN